MTYFLFITIYIIHTIFINSRQKTIENSNKDQTFSSEAKESSVGRAVASQPKGEWFDSRATFGVLGQNTENVE